MKVVNEVSTFKVTVPAGTYWLGDPCYAVPQDLWMTLLDSCDYFTDNPVGTVTGSDGRQYHVLGFSTAYGDGCYEDQHGNEYPVDAGMIGLTPVGLVESYPHGCKLVEFTEDTLCTWYEGVMKFGSYKINTKDFDEDNEEEEQD